jgi:hypothetical protein
MRKVMKIFRLLWWLGGERASVALYLFSAFCFIVTCFLAKAYFRLQLLAFVVFLAVNAAFALRAAMETLMDAVIETLQWLYYDAPLLPRLFRLARWAWQRRESAMKAVYLWSYRLLERTERFSQEHSTVENLLIGAVVASVACFVSGFVYILTTNRYPPFGPVPRVSGYVFIAGVFAFLFLSFVELLNAAMEWFYRLRARGFFDALRLAVSVFIEVWRELVNNRVHSSRADSAVFPHEWVAEGPGEFVATPQNDAGMHEPLALAVTVLPPLEKEPHQCR